MKKTMSLIISLVIAVLLIYATGVKFWSYMQSKIGFDFFPFMGNYHKVLFWGLMFFQVVIASLLVFNRIKLKGLYSSFFLLACLSTYLYIMQHYTDHVPCSCTGIIPGLSWQGHFWFTIGFTILAGIGIALLPDKDIHAHG